MATSIEMSSGQGTGIHNFQVEEGNGTGHNNVDEGWQFLRDHGTVGQTGTAKELDAIRRKVDLGILPLLCLCYTLQFIDKALLNYAAVMGLIKDLDLKGNDFSNAATAFWIAYLVFEPVNSYFLQKVPAAKWFGFSMLAWGIIMAAIAAVNNFTGLLAARIMLGITEATIIPSFLLMSSQWYTKSEQALRFAVWSAGIGLGQLFGALISYAFQHVKDRAWQKMFLVIGIISAAVGASTLFVLPDTPMDAGFLTTEEKVLLLRHISSNKIGIRNTRIRWPQVLETVKDPQVWLLVVIVVLQTETSGVVATYSSTLIKNMGFNSKDAVMLNAPSGMVTIAFTLLIGFGARKTSNRWAWIAFCSIPGIIGGGLMSFLDGKKNAGILAGIYLVNVIIAPFPIISHWLAANCAGHTKRALASCLLAMAFSAGNIIGPQTFQARDAPEYRPAKIAVLATQAASAAVTVLLLLYYRWENKRRDKRHNTVDDTGQLLSSDTDDWAGLTDRQNPRFRYVY